MFVTIIIEWNKKHDHGCSMCTWTNQRFYVMSTEFVILPGVYLLWDTTYMRKWYLTSWSNMMMWIFSVWDYYIDDIQANSYKQWNKNVEIAHYLVCWEKHIASAILVFIVSTCNDSLAKQGGLAGQISCS